MEAQLLLYNGKNQKVTVYFNPRKNIVEVGGETPTTEGCAAIKNLLDELSNTVTNLIGAWGTDNYATDSTNTLIREAKNHGK